MSVKVLGAGPVIGPGLRMSRPSQILPYRDGRSGGYPLGNWAGTTWWWWGERRGTKNSQHLKAAKQTCKSSHFKGSWKLLIGQSIECRSTGVHLAELAVKRSRSVCVHLPLIPTANLHVLLCVQAINGRWGADDLAAFLHTLQFKNSKPCGQKLTC